MFLTEFHFLKKLISQNLGNQKKFLNEQNLKFSDQQNGQNTNKLFSSKLERFLN